jgi:hypothetical protein
MHPFILKTGYIENATTCGTQAEALLRAWMVGDSGRLEAELEKSLSADLPAANDGEEERVQLLRAVAGRMRSCPDPFAPWCVDPGLDLCLDLLTHLISGGGADSKHPLSN